MTYDNEIKTKEHYFDIVRSFPVKSNKEIVIIDFYTSWCDPCRIQHRIFDGYKEKKNKIDIPNGRKKLEILFPSLKIYKIDCEKNDGLEEITNKLGISSIPQLIYFDQGVEKLEPGVKTLEDIVRFIDLRFDGDKNREQIKIFLEKMNK